MDLDGILRGTTALTCSRDEGWLKGQLLFVSHGTHDAAIMLGLIIARVHMHVFTHLVYPTPILSASVAPLISALLATPFLAHACTATAP